jgi:hypothetical protein
VSNHSSGFLGSSRHLFQTVQPIAELVSSLSKFLGLLFKIGGVHVATVNDRFCVFADVALSK